MPGLRSALGSHARSAILLSMLSALLGLAMNATLARTLPRDDLGALFVLVSLIGVLATLAQGGVLQPMLRQISVATPAGDAGSPAGCAAASALSASTAFSAALLYLAFGYSIVCGAVLVLDSGFHSASSGPVSPFFGERGIPFKWLALWLLAVAVQGLVAESFRALRLISRAYLFSGILVNAGVIAGVAGLMLFGNSGQFGPVLMVVVSIYSAVAILGLGLLQRCLPLSFAAVRLDMLTGLMRESLPILAFGLCVAILNQSDLWIVGWKFGADSAGVYGAAVKLAVLAGIPAQISISFISPYVATLHAEGDPRRLQQVVQTTTALASLPSIGFFLLVCFAGQDILRMIYGPEFEEAKAVLMILSAGHTIHVLFGPCGLALTLLGHGGLALRMTLVSTGFFTLMMFTLTPFGMTATAFGVALTLMFHKALLWWSACQKLQLNTLAMFSGWRVFSRGVGGVQ